VFLTAAQLFDLLTNTCWQCSELGCGGQCPLWHLWHKCNTAVHAVTVTVTQLWLARIHAGGMLWW